MNESHSYAASAKPLTARDYTQLSDFIHSHCGIKMPPAKRVMLEARLQKRIRLLGLPTLREYCDYLFSEQGGPEELAHFIDAVTTNKTDFFREPAHFHFLEQVALPAFLHENEGRPRRLYSVWSAGCSSGEEPYTIAMVLADFATRHPGFRYSILGTDISGRVLEKARLAIYEKDLAAPVPFFLKQKYLLQSRDRKKGLTRVAPELRTQVLFRKLNLMDRHYGIAEPFDAIFCRNVIIYFDRETQGKLIGRLCRHIKKGGHLFLGHSETVHGFELPLERVSSTIYRKV